MNTVRIPRLLKQATFLFTFIGLNLLLTACGGGDGKSSSKSSSSSSSLSSHTFSSTPVTPPLSGTWPDVKVSAKNTKTLKFDWTAAPDATYYKLFKKPDSNSAYVQVGSDFNALTISDPVSVHLTDWVNSRYKVQACTADNVCSDSHEIIIDSAMLTAITYFKASNADADDWFGWSIALSGDGKTLAVGAPAEASNAVGINGNQANNESPTSGAVYVFVKVDGNWVQEAYLKASNTEQHSDNKWENLPNDRFGYQVALSDDGNTLAVSAINEDSPSYGINCRDDNFVVSSTYSSSSSTYSVSVPMDYDVGAIYIFKRTNATWSQASYIKPSNTLAYALTGKALNFGSHIALSGDGKTLAVGNENDFYIGSGILMASNSSVLSDTSSSTSSARCFEYYPSSSSSSSISSVSSSSKSSSSSSVSNSSSSTDVSVRGGTNSGGVYIFRETETGWMQDAVIKASDAYVGDSFGASIDLSQDGNTLAVGAVNAEELVLNSSSSSVKARMTLKIEGRDYYALDNMNSGAVYVYKRTGDMWQESSKIKPTNQGWDQQFGYAVSLSDDGNTLAVGTPGDWSTTSGTASSPTYTYEADIQITSSGYLYIVPKLDMTRAKSAYASGAVYIYKYSDANGWSPDGYIKASNPQTFYQFGSTLSLSGSGDVLAVGCYRESSQAVGVGGDEADLGAPSSGAAYVFKRSDSATSSWTQLKYIKAPNTHTEDRFARALSIDFTGDVLAVGAYRESIKSSGINGDEEKNYSDPHAVHAPASGAAYLY